MRRWIVIGAAGVMAFSVVWAAAASLTVTSPSLGASTASVSSCDANGVATAYTTAYGNGDGRYEITTVTVSGVDDSNCDGKTISVALTQTGSSVGTGSAAVSNGTTSYAIAIAAAPSAAVVDGIAVAVG